MEFRGINTESTTRDDAAGFTLLEVLVALMVAMIGLMGTVAVQMSVLGASKNANDGAVALRLATQSMEEFNARLVRLPTLDLLKPVATGVWTVPLYLDVNGSPVPPACVDGQGKLVQTTQCLAFRWSRRTMVLDRGVALPYNVSVEISYALDTGVAKVVRLDMERRKQW